MEEKVFIYSLADPRNPNDIKYIGKTKDYIKRLKSHIAEAKKDRHKLTRSVNWIRSLLKENIIPLMEIIDVVDLKDWELFEKHYISLYRSWGFTLYNHHEGGSVGINGNLSKESKYKLRETHYFKAHPEATEEDFQNYINKYPTSRSTPKGTAVKYTLLQLDAVTGELLNRFDSTYVAAKELGFRYNRINEAILGGNSYKKNTGLNVASKKRILSYKGFVFIYEKDYDPTKDYRPKRLTTKGRGSKLGW